MVWDWLLLYKRGETVLSDMSSATNTKTRGPLQWLKLAIVAGLFVGLSLTPKLWLSDRLYPTTPVFEWMGTIPPPFDCILYTSMLILLAAITVMPRPTLAVAAFIAIAIVEVLFDQSRLQPWFYQYLFMLTAVGFGTRVLDHNRRDLALDACRLIIVCIYFWSGAQKLHVDFVNRIFPWLLEPFTRLLPQSIAAIVNACGIVAPLTEMAIGVGLLFRPVRKYAIFAAIGMHALILLSLGPLGKSLNAIVWPWNMAMVAFLFILFWNRSDLTVRQMFWARGFGFQKVALLMFGFAPALSFFNVWDGGLSAALYAGTRNDATLYVTGRLADRLPKSILEHVYVDKAAGMNKIHLYEWSEKEMGVPFYSEPRIFKSVARSVCSYARQPNDLKLVIRQRRVLLSPDLETAYDCGKLLGPGGGSQ